MGIETIVSGDMPTKLNTSLPLYTDPLSQGDDHIRNIKTVLKSFYDKLVGVPLPRIHLAFLDTSVYRLFDGTAIDVNVDPLLYSMYGATMPDLQGRALQGMKASGETIGSQLASQNLYHSHTGSAAGQDLGTKTVANADLGTKTTSGFDYGTKTTKTGEGNHKHEIQTSKQGTGASSGYTWETQRYWFPQDTESDNGSQHTHSMVIGAHDHTISIGTHKHSVALGSHSHTLTIGSNGGSEVRLVSTLCQWMCFRG